MSEVSVQWIEDAAACCEAGDDAVFDADGTLWRGDVGEAYHEALCDEGRLPRETLREYTRLLERDFTEAYAYGTRLLAGWDEAELRAHTAAFVRARFAHEVFPEMRTLVGSLRRRGVNVWIASASARWLVEAGAELLDIEPARVFGMSLHVEAGRTTEVLHRPLVTREGKAELLRTRFPRLPALVAGNSTNDLPMLRLAQKLALVVNAAPGADPSTGDDLAAEADAKGWLRRSLRPPR